MRSDLASKPVSDNKGENNPSNDKSAGVKRAIYGMRPGNNGTYDGIKKPKNDELHSFKSSSKLSTGSFTIKPDFDEKYLKKDCAFNYTSQFQARIHAERFDFNEDCDADRHLIEDSVSEQDRYTDSNELIEKYDCSGNVDGDQKLDRNSGSQKQIEEGHLNGVDFSRSNDQNFQESSEDDNNILYDGVSEYSDEPDESIRIIFEKLTKFKDEYRGFIAKLDEASLLSAKIRYKFLDESVLRGNLFLSDAVERMLESVSGNLSINSYGEHAVHKIASDDSDEFSTADPFATLLNVSQESDPCSKLTNFGVVLIKSPSSVEQLWDEYTKLPSDGHMKDYLRLLIRQQTKESYRRSDISLLKERQTTIQQLEIKYGSTWRNSDKNFSRQINRRKKIWNSIETGLRDGLSLKACFCVLERYAEEKGRGLSWYYNGVPFRLSEKAQFYNLV